MNKKLLIAVVFTPLFLIVSTTFAQTTGNEQVCFCHNLPNNPHTICTDNSALKTAHSNHVAIGFDSAGECPVATPTQVPTATPTVTQTPTSTPTPTNIPTATPTVTQTPTSTPTPTVTLTPTITPPQPTPPIYCQLPRGSQVLGLAASGGTNIRVSNYNLLCASQTSTSVNISGGNTVTGNIGGGSIQTGQSTSTTNQTITGNSNNTVITILGGFVQNFTSIFNTGSGSSFNTNSSH